jgi:signal peptidase I
VIVAMAIGLALGIQAFLVKPYQIPSPSMEPTLVPGERVLVNRLSYTLGGDPSVGDVVVFHPPTGADPNSANQCGVNPGPNQACAEGTGEQSDQNFIKRIVAGPGDTLYIEDGHPVVNGVKMEDEPYIRPCSSNQHDCNLQEPIEIPPDQYFMMGDNRGSSDDSRFWGPVPKDWIIGKAFFTYWPPDEVGIF